MAQHGYLREYDEGWDRDEGRGRGSRDWSEGERNWRGSERSWSDRSERDRNFMFEDQDRGRGRDRGFFERIGDEARSWFSDDDEGRSGRRGRSGWEETPDWPQSRSRTSGYGREHGYGGYQGDYSRGGRGQGGFGGSGDYEGGRRSFSSHPDAHYLSWRQRQIEALDRDYEEYCRDCEQRFHQDFDSWRRNRQQQGSGQDPQMSSDRETGADAPRQAAESQAGTNPLSSATMGTNNSENSGTSPARGGRGRR